MRAADMRADGPTTSFGPATGADEYLSLRDVVAFVRRNLLWIVLTVTGAVALAGWYVASTPPTFTATARLYIDPDQVSLAAGGRDGGGVASLDTAMVESQVEIVKSEAIALAVIRQHDLINDLELLDSSSIAGTVKGWVRAGLTLVRPTKGDRADRLDPSEEETLAIVMSRFYGRLGVRRVGQSYLIQISYRSTDREKAARLANATASAYIGASLNAKARAAGQGSSWLERRIAELGEQANATATAVQAFRAENGLVDTGDGRSLSERELVGTSDEVLGARAAVADAAARLETIDAMLERGDVAVFVDDAVRSGTIARLRERLVEARAEARVLTDRYGEDGKAARGAQARLGALETEVRVELGRIRQSYAAELEAAEAREARVRANLGELVGAAGGRAGAEVALAELEARQNAYRRMYATALEQFEAAQQKASFPVADARIVMPATVPVNKSHPKSALLVAMAGAFGTIGGLGLALLRESLDRRVGGARIGLQLQRELGIGVLGSLARTRFRPRRRERPEVPSLLPRRRAGALSYVLDAPRSPFSEAMRDIRASIDLAWHDARPRILAVTSIEPGEGRTTVAANLALLYASSGARTLLIDADRADGRLTDTLSPLARSGEGARAGERHSPHPPALPTLAADAARDLTPDAEHARARHALPPATDPWDDEARLEGAVAALSAGRDATACPGDVRAEDARPPITVMDVGELTGGRAVLESPGLACLRPRLEALRETYDVVVLDLPHMRGSSGVRSLAPSIDGIVMVVRHRRVTIDTLAAAIASFGTARSRVLGAVLSHVPGRA